MSTLTIDHDGTQRRIGRGRVGSYLEDEIVIGLPYEALVMSQLTAWHAGPHIAGRDRDPRLGLARASLDAAAAVAHLRGKHPQLVTAALAGAEQAGYAASDLDVLSRCLVAHFRAEYSGWVPTFAKNRIVGRRVDGFPHVIDGGAMSASDPVLTLDHVIDGGGTRGSGPVLTPDHVIDGGGTGGSGPVLTPDHVIDGGAASGSVDGPDPSTVVVVRPRGGRRGRGVRVGIVDTRIAPHPWLAGGYSASPADVYGRTRPEPWSPLGGHATFVAGLVLRQAPGAVLVIRGALNQQAQSDSWSVARSIATLADEGLDVLNLSLGCATDDGMPPLVLSAALATLSPETVVVAAAGNHGLGPEGKVPVPSWPAALDGVVCVGALDGRKPADFSPPVPWVDVYAEGVEVASTCDLGAGKQGDAFGRWSGTSFAAAIVSGAIARRVTPDRTARAVWTQLRRRAERAGKLPVITGSSPKDWPQDHPEAGGSDD